MRKTSVAGLAVSLALGLVRGGAAEILGTSARQLQKGSLKILAYYQGFENRHLGFGVRGRGACATPGNVSFPCNESTDLEAHASGRGVAVKAVFQPWESFQYYVGFGGGDFDLKVPSTTLTNLLTGDKPGYEGRVGLKWVFVPDTVVNPAFAVDAGIKVSRHYFNRRFPGGTPGANNNINQRLDLTETQVSFETSHLFSVEGLKAEPYGGVQWGYAWADLKDLIDGGHAAGGRHAIRPFLGLRVPVFEHEGLFAEASFVDGTRYAGGLEVRF